jgi:hypothetical protein
MSPIDLARRAATAAGRKSGFDSVDRSTASSFVVVVLSFVVVVRQRSQERDARRALI